MIKFFYYKTFCNVSKETKEKKKYRKNVSVLRAIARENPLNVATIEGNLCPERMMHNKTIWSGKNDFSYAINGSKTILSWNRNTTENKLDKNWKYVW